MPSTSHRVALAVILSFAVVASGCSSPADTPAASPESATTTSAQATPAPTTGAGPVPLTASERAWLAAIPTFMNKVEKEFSQQNVFLTPMKLREYGNLLRGCRRELARGLPSSRLRPVYTLILAACGQYEKGATCFATAARSASGTPTPDEDRAYNRGLDCGFAAQGKGLTSLADAFNVGEKIKIAANS
jgi:hypothetical protein